MIKNEYGIAAFRSRQQVLLLDAALKRKNLKTTVVSTPRVIALGCGLSVKFDLNQADQVMTTYRESRSPTLIGFYRVDATTQPLRVVPLPFRG